MKTIYYFLIVINDFGDGRNVIRILWIDNCNAIAALRIGLYLQCCCSLTSILISTVLLWPYE